MRPCHIHIPKCAGTSIKHFLYQEYGEKKVYVENTWTCAEAVICENPTMEGYLAFAGHTPLEFYRRLLQDRDDLFCFAFVRDPMARRQSEYAYIRRTPEHEVHNLVTKQSFEDFLRSPDRQWNEQCRYLTADNNDRTLEAVQAMIEFYSDNLIVAPVKDTSIVFVELAKRFHWSSHTLPLDNVSMPRERPEISPKARKFVSEIDEEDQKLFDWIKQRALKQ